VSLIGLLVISGAVVTALSVRKTNVQEKHDYQSLIIDKKAIQLQRFKEQAQEKKKLEEMALAKSLEE
jgi:hypothetical protein